MKTLGFAAALLAGSVLPCLASGYGELNAGILSWLRDDTDGALAHFDNALALGGLTADQEYIAHYDRAAILSAKGATDKAIADLTICIGQRAGDDQALLRRARLYIAAQKNDEALRDIDDAIVTDPNDPAPYALRVQLYGALGDPEKEIADLEALQIKQPNNKGLSFAIAIAKIETGRFADGATALKQLIYTKPGYAWLWLALANQAQGKAIPEDSDGLLAWQWPGPIVKFIQGKLSLENIQDAAKDEREATQKGQLCEVNYYAGAWRQLRGDSSGKTLLEAAVRDCPHDFIEWNAARLELKNAHQGSH